jgi:hypothetical protein
MKLELNFEVAKWRKIMTTGSDQYLLRTVHAIVWHDAGMYIENLPSDESAEFDKWDRDRPEGVATSDWPVFAKYRPARPWESIER